MAAVAAEPGAAAASTTAGDGVEYEPEPGEHVVDLEAHPVPKMELCHQPEDVDAVQECSQVQLEIRRPDLQAAGKALAAHADGELTETRGSWGRLDTAEQPAFMDYKCAGVSDYGGSFSPKVEAANEVSPPESSPCLLLPSSISDSQHSVVFLHSLPSQVPSEPETGLSLAVEYDSSPVSSHPTDLECEIIGFTQPDPEPEPAYDALGSELKSHEDAFHDIPQPSDHLDCLSNAEETSLGESVGQSYISDFSTVSSKDSPGLPSVVNQSLISSVESDQVGSHHHHHHHHQSFKTDLSEPETESETKAPVLCAEEADTAERLVLGSEVRVSLDHIIDDALVVSFRLGEKIFSGVLMDLSKR